MERAITIYINSEPYEILQIKYYQKGSYYIDTIFDCSDRFNTKSDIILLDNEDRKMIDDKIIQTILTYLTNNRWENVRRLIDNENYREFLIVADYFGICKLVNHIKAYISYPYSKFDQSYRSYKYMFFLSNVYEWLDFSHCFPTDKIKIKVNIVNNTIHIESKNAETIEVDPDNMIVDCQDDDTGSVQIVFNVGSLESMSAFEGIVFVKDCRNTRFRIEGYYKSSGRVTLWSKTWKKQCLQNETFPPVSVSFLASQEDAPSLPPVPPEDRFLRNCVVQDVSS